MNDKQDIENNKEYHSFALKRGLLACLIVIALVWALAVGLGYLEKPQTLLDRMHAPSEGVDAQTKGAEKTSGHQQDQPLDQSPEAQFAAPHEALSQTDKTMPSETASHPMAAEAMGNKAEAETAQAGSAEKSHDDAAVAAQGNHVSPPAEDQKTAQAAKAEHGTEKTAVEQQASPPEPVHLPTGVAFIDAVSKPLEFELKKRFWGWRPNDFINVTDNINSFQLGVLEVTRRTVVQLAERISRTGSTDSFDPNLENAMNWVMVKATKYWFPSPESKYKECLDELAAYREKLIKKKASFHTRTDNLIPLLAAYEDLLGSCDENLVKFKEEDGTKVGYFKTDDYFYYAKGVASAMATILEAVHHDFAGTLEGRHAVELLHHALVSCQRAASLDPWLITDSELDGFLANHRANMAAPISHARFFLGQLVKTLST